MTSLQQEHNWLVDHHKEAEKYGGRWIAILNQKIVAVGKTFQEAHRKASKQYPEKIPLVIYVPKKGEEFLIV